MIIWNKRYPEFNWHWLLVGALDRLIVKQRDTCFLGAEKNIYKKLHFLYNVVCFSLLEVALFVTGGGGTPSCHYNSILPPVSGFGDRKQGRVKINQRFVCSNGELIRYRANDGHPGLTSPNNWLVSAVPTHHYRPSSPKNDQTNGDWISPNYACLLLLYGNVLGLLIRVQKISFALLPLFYLKAIHMKGSAVKSLLTSPVKGLMHSTNEPNELWS